jgi:cytochrome c-type protein NapC
MSNTSWIQALLRPSTKYSVGVLLAVGLVAGIVAVPSFLFTIHETSTDAFCLNCHADNIGLEMAGRVHFDNATGHRAECAGCHIPKAFIPKLYVKTTTGINDVYETIRGKINTREKFEEHRMEMAMSTWKKMNANDSRECRYCHEEAKWDLSKQTEKARKYHSPALANGKTCIDCHKGIAHELPQGIVEDEQIEGLDF